MVAGHVIASGKTRSGSFAWVRVCAFSAGASIRLGSRGAPVALVTLGGYLAEPGNPWDQIEAVGAEVTVETGGPLDPYPGPPVKP